ncbi:5-methyltetrahydropteroyltriglutamate--homocysteine S-methyltransferase [Kribbella sp. NPDC056861]|uniref:5-methyltetrahydropteroyltriglutamate-- homocysteine S-methyltransferase n=1 Tax=Kribbella sp. NPDC056861 TaxID=3154857 RepID=UPI00342CD4AE
MKVTTPARSTVYGYPRQGPHRELKKAVEGYWQGVVTAPELHRTAAELRAAGWQQLVADGIDEVPTGDFSYYDHLLDTTVMVGATPQRYRTDDPLDTYFAMARGTGELAPLELTKWFDTNYHYLVPELGPDTTFTADSSKQTSELTEALALGLSARPVLIGPITFLLLAKPSPEAPSSFTPLSLLDQLLPIYAEILADLQQAGAEWVQLDEPALVQDRTAEELDATRRTYDFLGNLTTRPKLLIASYFDQLGEALPILTAAPVEGLAIDFTGPAAANLEALTQLNGKRLVAGIIDGRNVWAADLAQSLNTLTRLTELTDQLDVAASCSLQHVPIDLDAETDLDPEVRPWLAFARQKVRELSILKQGLTDGPTAIAPQLEANHAAFRARNQSPLTNKAHVSSRLAAIRPTDTHRATPYAERRAVQQAALDLPLLPTTTIGSFPQTDELRAARADLLHDRIDQARYDERIEAEIRTVLAFQEEAGLDVAVHGEPERDDLVQHLAEQLAGFVSTRQGWVQSYGTRYVRPPILAGDVYRSVQLTSRWTKYAQSQTSRPVKGLLTGPVTMLARSFVRDDQPITATARQVALALRDEVVDLEIAGIAIIQVDEPALREALPLRQADRAAYLAWATEAFRLTTNRVRPTTQIHTHMCYAEFSDILAAIAEMDADVVSLEAARSHLAIAHKLGTPDFPRAVGLGVYDVHSPRVPSAEEIASLLREALTLIPAERLWVTPDCGLKTRAWPEVREALTNLVTATHQVRNELSGG